MVFSRVAHQFSVSVVSLLIVVFAGGCSDANLISPEPGATITTYRVHSGYTRVSVSRGLSVNYTIGTTDTIRLDVSEGYMPYVQTRVEGGTLVLTVDDNVDIGRMLDKTISITVPNLSGIELSGSSVFSGTDTLRPTDFQHTASGAYQCTVACAAQRVFVSSSGASAWKLDGQATSLIVSSASGASVIRAFGLPVDNVSLSLSGASRLETTVSTTITGSASGESIITYRGQPGQINVSTSGGSTVRPE